MQLYPSKSEVLEMLRCAQQCAQRSAPNYLTFGEFCVFATELKRCVDKGISRPAQLSRLLERDGGDKRRTRRKVSKGLPKHEVFLGGSCNPTTWRQDVAIPLLKDLGITFFNPQVSDWAPELIEKEHYAKQNAAVLFFVMDNQTRNAAAAVEVAFFTGLRRSLVLVVNPYQPTGCEVAGEAILEDELEDLAAGQQVMQLLAERQGIPCFPNIPQAVHGIAKVLWENVSVHELQPIKKGSTQISDRLMKLREAFDAVDSERTGKISLGQVRLAFWILNNRNLPLSDLRSAGVLEKEAKENVSFENLQVNFDQFCAIVAEFKSNQERWNISPLHSLLSNQQTSFDVYLGGSSTNTSWRDDVAIPLMKKNSLRYIIPPSNQWTKQVVHSCITLAERSRVVLFIITDTSRSLAELNMAAYYIGLGYDVVLCVQLLTEESVINGKLLSKLAVKDYNRGRMYLRDLAVREGVPVLDSVSAAVELAASKCLKSNTVH
ncbi:hypothetical protein ONE63_003948 [Megalurothrips usitatus]|uniref:EF-hand domain-containing protein n=1 Tax=Megalurothrips usitatus TaxID=439358 RepID=A0AAV7X820_9NEOP|nr:hypothetical protein ONE63_003948 [Megalurothrips usitatus]